MGYPEIKAQGNIPLASKKCSEDGADTAFLMRSIDLFCWRTFKLCFGPTRIIL
jgi:hypothetical protein